MDIKLSTRPRGPSTNGGDNAMYWGIISHDKAGLYFRHIGKSLDEMRECLSKIDPTKSNSKVNK
jgi:hypothetical protein